ncbi:hypothetical protein [Arthrobacter glacialis]|uniref:hypothetical protein n=1 Tax=Arthrobacter glacialis TaxID=1664 RepID=UPI0010575ADB|nr:hypothetical protein [Arthrobacter glacialis]
MYGIGELLFGRMNGPLDVASMALTILGALLICASLGLLARRSDTGWWLAGAAFLLQGLAQLMNFPGLLAASTTGLLMFAAGVAIPLAVAVGSAAYGFLSFQKLPQASRRLRTFALRPFSGVDLLAPAAVALVYALGSMLVVASIFAGFSAPLARIPWASLLLTGFLMGLLPAALVGLAHRSRWAWLLVIVASVASVYSTTMLAQGSVLIFLFVAQAALAFLGWQRWGTFPTYGPKAAR